MSTVTVTADSLHELMRRNRIDGYVVESDGEFYIPVFMAHRPGHGDCSRFLDALPHDVTIKVPDVLSPQLAGMLERRGFKTVMEWAAEFDEWVEVYIRRAGA